MSTLRISIQNLTSTITSLLQHGTTSPADKDFWYYLIYILSFLIVLIVLSLTIKYLIHPKEESKNHIKRVILSDERNDAD